MSCKLNQTRQKYLAVPMSIPRSMLSFEARGVMFTLLSLEREGLPITVESLQKSCRDSVDIIHEALAELEEAGFISLEGVC